MASKLLIVTGEAAVAAEQLPFGVLLLIEEASEIAVVSPVLPSRLDWLTNATDKLKSEADERLRAVIGQIADDETEVRGAVGSDDPLVAIDDAVRGFAPDHLLIGLRREDRAGWQERGLLDQLQGRYAIPITVFEVPAG
jgi:hypothetical protein